MIKLGIVAVLAGLALGVCCYFAIQDVDTVARGEPLPPERGLYGRQMMPEFGTAIVSLFLGWLGLMLIHRSTGMCGRVLWLPLGLSALAAVVASLILVAVEFGTLPSATWKVLAIGLPFMATGGMLAVSMAKHSW